MGFIDFAIYVLLMNKKLLTNVSTWSKQINFPVYFSVKRSNNNWDSLNQYLDTTKS